MDGGFMALSESEMELVFRGYVECALWSSTDNSDDAGGEPLDSNYGIADIDSATLEAMRADTEAFVAANAADCDTLVEDGLVPDAGYIGHDIWLTRNHHGAGFWDRGFPQELSDRLTEASQAMGEMSLVVGDDGRVYQERG